MRLTWYTCQSGTCATSSLYIYLSYAPQPHVSTTQVGTHPMRSATTYKRSACTALVGTHNPVGADPRAGTGHFPKPRALVLPMVKLGQSKPDEHGNIDTADSDLMHHQYRLSVLQWNPGPARKNLTNIIAAACGRFHAVILQEASDHVQHISGQFIAHTGNTDLAILLNKDTFEPDPTVLAFRGELHKPKYVGHGATHRSLHFLEHQLLHFADSLWIFSRFRSNFPLHLITSHFLATLSSPHSEHWRHTCTMWVTSAKRLGPRSLQFPSIMGAPGGDDNLTHTLSLRDASTCATRS